MNKGIGLMLCGLVLFAGLVDAKKPQSYDWYSPCHDYGYEELAIFHLSWSNSPVFAGGIGFPDGNTFWAEGTKNTVTWSGTFKKVLLVSEEATGTQTVYGKKTGTYNSQYGEIQTIHACAN